MMIMLYHLRNNLIYLIIKKYDAAWNDVKKAQDLGFQIHPQLLKRLREESGKAR